jgi:hypothetical protein
MINTATAKICGVTETEFYRFLGNDTSIERQRCVFAALAAAHLGHGPDLLAELLGPWLGCMSRWTLGRLVLAGCNIVLAALPAPPLDDVLRYAADVLPGAYWITDTFPVRRRGGAGAFNPKYGAKIDKYAAITDLAGRIIVLQKLPGCRINDGFAFRAASYELEQRGLGIGDKAYIGISNIISPPKFSKLKRELTDDETHFTQLLQLLRSPIERCFARLHNRWGCMRFLNWREEIADELVEMVARIESVLRPPPPTRHLRPYQDGDFVTQDKDLCEKVGQRRSRHYDLTCQASGHRLKGQPAWKRPRLEKLRFSKKHQ